MCHATDADFSPPNDVCYFHGGEAIQELRQAGSSLVTAAFRRDHFCDDDLPGHMSNFYSDSTISIDRGDDGDLLYTCEPSLVLPSPNPGHNLGDFHLAMPAKFQLSASHAFHFQQTSQLVCAGASDDGEIYPSDAGNDLFLVSAANAFLDVAIEGALLCRHTLRLCPPGARALDTYNMEAPSDGSLLSQMCRSLHMADI